MALSRFQFTIGQLVQVIILSGLVFWLMRATGASSVLLAFPAIDSLVRARTRAAMGIGRSTICRGLVLIAFAIAYCSYFDFFGAPHALQGVEITFAIYFLFVTAPVLSRLWRAVIDRGYEMPPTDEKCGSIAWEGFRDWPGPATAVPQLPLK